MISSFIGGLDETVATWNEGKHHVAVVIESLDDYDLDNGVTLGTPYVALWAEDDIADLDPSQARGLGEFLHSALSDAADRLEEILATRDTIA